MVWRGIFGVLYCEFGCHGRFSYFSLVHVCERQRRSVLVLAVLDQSSCLAVVVMGFFAGVPMGFHCFPRLRLIYITLCLAVCFLMALLVAFLPKERWDTIANVIIAGSVVVYIVPAIHWLVICEKGRDAIGPLFLSQLVCTGSAAIFFTQYIPERFAPGWFDRFGNSHQLWHIAIYMSAALFGECLVRVYGLIESGSFCN